MKSKLLAAMVVVGMIAGISPVLAQTSAVSTTSLQVLLQSLQAQLQDLQTKWDAARQVQTQAVTTLKLISQLKQGATGDDVKLLQAILAADPSIYPEGSITGYFGRLTAKAVKLFQKKNGLSQVGNVGPKTLEKLNEELDKNPVSHEKDEKGVKRPCAIVPPGHLIAPGWLRKQDGVKPIVPACQVLPSGISSLLNATTTTTSTVSLAVSQVVATSITATSTHISWITNLPASSKVWYSTSTPVGISTASVVSDSSLVVNHDLVVTGLSAGTTYFYWVWSADTSGNSVSSAQASFMMLGM